MTTSGRSVSECPLPGQIPVISDCLMPCYIAAAIFYVRRRGRHRRKLERSIERRGKQEKMGSWEKNRKGRGKEAMEREKKKTRKVIGWGERKNSQPISCFLLHCSLLLLPLTILSIYILFFWLSHKISSAVLIPKRDSAWNWSCR